MNIIKQNWLGIAGLIGLCLGIPMHPGILQNSINIISLLLLIIYAKIGKNDFFLYLEFVVLLGTVLQIVHVSGWSLSVILIIAAVLAMVKIFKNPAYRVWYTGFGMIGLAGLVYGYATLSPYGYAIGGVGSFIYSLICFSRGLKSALIFSILNAIYVTLAIYMIIQSVV